MAQLYDPLLEHHGGRHPWLNFNYLTLCWSTDPQTERRIWRVLHQICLQQDLPKSREASRVSCMRRKPLKFLEHEIAFDDGSPKNPSSQLLSQPPEATQEKDLRRC